MKIVKWIGAFVLCTVLLPFDSARSDHNAFHKTEEKARGQSVWFAAWAGDEKINDYLRWAGKEIQTRYGVTLKHFKLDNTADAVRRILAEKSAGKHTQGGIDLIWINGENFRTMKKNGLLFGPFVDRLPNARYIDRKNKPATVMDFTIPTDGYESPWGMAQLVFIYNKSRVKKPPRTLRALLLYAERHHGRFTYPAPPDFIGTTFLKQLLYDFGVKPSRLSRPVASDFDAVTEPLWVYLDELHPFLWQKGRNFPESWPKQNQLFNDGEVTFSLTFNPNDVSASIKRGTLPASARPYVLDGGTIGNAHFVAIPYNARAKEGAQVVANFLLSAEAQAHKADTDVWGDPTVLAVSKLPRKQRKLFKVGKGIAQLSDKELGKSLPEPHPTWSEKLKAEWQRRYRK